ncbi:unnamed protein product [Fraxinus pennsylvanica]|uniref:Uncharacterized protein n=1 Tax=Fraxinus pennsylvanica TaxID=56036 RepID=A0AAD2DT62_9LAMI|nr:unnamed protein product [Fraxinus pennsylvanica]
MEAVAIEGVKFILEKLSAVAAEEINLVRGFKNELANLKKYLKKVNQVLEDAEKREITEKAVKSWLKDLKDVAYDADNGCLNFPCCTTTTLTFQREMAHKIKGISANFKSINKDADELGLNRDFKYCPLSKPPVMETTSFTVDPIFIGRENDKTEILKTITRSFNNVLSVLPIVGMGGLGKTTLARNIFKHPLTQTHFDERIWVCVSENFDKLDLFKRILEILLKQKFDGDSLEAVVQKTAEELKNKRYLLVLDDLWNEEEDVCPVKDGPRQEDRPEMNNRESSCHAQKGTYHYDKITKIAKSREVIVSPAPNSKKGSTGFQAEGSAQRIIPLMSVE